MKVFCIRVHHHYDDYKRAESYSKIDKVFLNEEDAYKYSIEKILDKIYNKYENFKEILENDKEEGIDVNDQDYFNTYEKEFCEFIDSLKYENLSYKDKYKKIDIEFLFGEPKFTMFPTHTFWYVDECLIE